MPDVLITGIDQVTPQWLTFVLARSGALTYGAVTSFDLKPGHGNWSTNSQLNLRYQVGSQGTLPQHLFLKIVNTDINGESFGDSEVTYYTRDYVGAAGVPLVHCYDAAFSEEKHHYHLLLDDLTETHIEAAEKAPTLEYGLALAEGLAAMHAHWWGMQRFTTIGAVLPNAGQIQRFVDLAEAGVGRVLNRYSAELKPHWPGLLRELFAKHPQAILGRTRDDNGFTLIHGDVGQKNILVPRDGDKPVYILDRQPFAWALTTWLGAYDLAYAIVLDWEVEERRSLEMAVLRHYHNQLLKKGVRDYPWERLYDDYRLCAAMCVYVASEYFRSGSNEQWISTWLLMLQRSLTACDDLDCRALW